MCDRLSPRDATILSTLKYAVEPYTETQRRLEALLESDVARRILQDYKTANKKRQDEEDKT